MMIDNSNRKHVDCEHIAKQVAGEVEPWIDDDKIKYRTFRCYKNNSENRLSNGDIIIHKELVGRVIAITVPLDEDMTAFAVDFAFCGKKENFKKEFGKKLALNKLVTKGFARQDVTVIHRTNPFQTVTDAIREIIVEHGDVISWLHGVKKENIL